MNQHRIFIAINFPEAIREKLFDLCASWHDMPFRWTKKDDIHITLVFVGYLVDEQLLKVIDCLKEAWRGIEPFEIRLEEITLAPTAKNPRYIWVHVKAPQELQKLHDSIENKLNFAGIRFKRDYYPYKPHITLGRRIMGRGEFEAKEVLSESLNLTISVKSFEIMESFLSRGGARYQMIQSYKAGA
ncbi:RNA 2',3'-cyclic phosphodiesterase [Candidatus Parcubacteria bacterium]|nr:MAG: RNA 2',3'-cyclic phosphodiesterase [Candidatus Parcubacteria bacterium]